MVKVNLFRGEEIIASAEIPQSWGELTYNQYMALLGQSKKPVEERSVIDLFSILSDISWELWAESNPDSDDILIPYIMWVYEKPVWPEWKDKPFTFKGETYKIPQINLMSLNQKTTLQREMQYCYDRTEDLMEVGPLAVAIYMQPFITKEKFDLEKARDLSKEIEIMKMDDFFPLATFFLSKSLHLLQKKMR